MATGEMSKFQPFLPTGVHMPADYRCRFDSEKSLQAACIICFSEPNLTSKKLKPKQHVFCESQAPRKRAFKITTTNTTAKYSHLKHLHDFREKRDGSVA